jgi:hypothetical protein
MAILMGLLMGAIQRVRETANAMVSANNMRNIGLAVTNCATQNKGKIPGAWGRFRSSKPATCLIHILPYLDNDAAYKQYMQIASPDTFQSINDAMTSLDDSKFPVFVAPNDLSSDFIGWSGPNSSYALNYEVFGGNGVNNIGQINMDLSAGSSAILTIPPSNSKEPIFQLDKQFANGTSNSLLAVERAANLFFAAGTVSQMPLWYQNSTYQGKSVKSCVAGCRTISGQGIRTDNLLGINKTPSNPLWNPTPIPAKQVKPPVKTSDLAYVTAFQTSYFNALMADASVKNVSPNVSYDVFKAVTLVTSQGDSGLLSQWDD